jgi:hypothetical protein
MLNIDKKESYLLHPENLQFGQRVAHIIEVRGLSKAWIANKLGISKQALNYLLKHSLKPKFIDELAELLQINSHWLETGVGQASVVTKNEMGTSSSILIKTKSELLQGEKNIHQPDEFIEFSYGNNEAFTAYKLLDDSNFPPFIEGSILIFDKSREPSTGDYVLIIIENELYVRQYSMDGFNCFYKASNNKYKTFINPKIALLGVLIEARYQPHQLK